MQLSDLKDKAHHLPLSPGVYLMKDHLGAIIYVGKAKKLRQRVSSYFQKNTQHSNKTLRMIHNIADFETINVDTELDALLLECHLIQVHHPLYNRQLNFSQNYCYLRITPTAFELFPEKKENTLGPFRWYKKLPRILDTLAETYQMPWLPHITKIKLATELPEMVSWRQETKYQAIQAFFTGDDQQTLALMDQRIAHLAEQLNFEACQKLQSERTTLAYFSRNLRRQKQFLAKKEIIFSLPLEESQRKYYQVSYGRLLATQIVEREDKADFPVQIFNKRPLDKNELDPMMILLSFYEKQEFPKDKKSEM